MATTILIVALVGLALWLYLGGPTPGLLSSRTRDKAIISAWLVLRRYVADDLVRQKLDELLPLLLRGDGRESSS